MKKSNTPLSAFKPAEFVAIKAVDQICRQSLIARVVSVGQGMLVRFSKPPLWWEKRERFQGFFPGYTFERTLSLLENQAGSYTALEDRRLYFVNHAPVRYFAYAGNEQNALRNGSFCRLTKHGFAHFMNGDHLGLRKELPGGNWTEINPIEASTLIPDCCR